MKRDGSIDDEMVLSDAAWLERMAGLGRIVGGLAHELNNVFGRILGFAELALEEEISEDVREPLEEVRDSVLEAAEYSRWLGRLSQRRRSSSGPVSIATVLDALKLLLAPELKAAGGSLVVTRPDESPVIEGDDVLIAEALMTACLLLHHHGPDGGRVVVSVETASDEVAFRLGVEQAHLNRSILMDLFEPVPRSAETKGTALTDVLTRMRLLVPQAIARSFGGDLIVTGGGDDRRDEVCDDNHREVSHGEVGLRMSFPRFRSHDASGD